MIGHVLNPKPPLGPLSPLSCFSGLVCGQAESIHGRQVDFDGALPWHDGSMRGHAPQQSGIPPPSYSRDRMGLSAYAPKMLIGEKGSQ